MDMSNSRKIIVYFLCALLVLGQGASFGVAYASEGDGVYWFMPSVRPEKIAGVSPGMSKAPLPRSQFIAELPTTVSGGEEGTMGNTAFCMALSDVTYGTGPSGDINVIPFVSEKNCFYLII